MPILKLREEFRVTVQAYPNVHPVSSFNGCVNVGEPLLNGNDDSLVNPPFSNATSSETCSQRQKKRLHSLSDMSFDERSSRHLAKVEYDWLATVIERCTFLLFLVAFLFVSLGINCVGFLHWTYSEPPEYAVRTTNPTL
ncbi:hypothetical protein Q1695_000682 [Nippostrongylus brasiliensis]|nr:hypothetical protein Q1695_000682 [Nippostrongylus brasiliensis]